jgi:HYR domain
MAAYNGLTPVELGWDGRLIGNPLPESYMRRSTLFVASISPLKAAITSALVLATMVACSDSTSPVKGVQDGLSFINMVVPDSLKQALSAQDAGNSFVQGSSTNLLSGSAHSANVLASPAAPAALAACGGGGSGFAGYTESRFTFDSLEAVPNKVVPRDSIKDDGIALIPVGFSFSFYGNNYDKVNVYSNGFVTFGVPDISADGFYRGGVIPSSSKPNNLIAFAWMDWSPQTVPDGIRYETRGTAPNRKFILQFTDVPEYHSTGRLTSQLVLSESSNDITIYTTKMTISNSGNRYTQGIENADGTNALYDSIQVALSGQWVPRRSTFFTGISLANDAIRFSLVSTKDVEKPSITAPESITQGNDPGLASAVVAVGSPVASDNCGDVKISSVRSDGAAIDAPYPVGITTITWTATDAAGNPASATQSVTVLDVEAPVFVAAPTFGPTASSDLRVNATSPAGAVVSFGTNVTDNVKVTSLSCEPASGSVFPAGTTNVVCTAADAAGNTSSKSFSVVVVGAKEQIAALTEMIREELTLSNGTANPLINQLNSAASDQANACQKMTVFLNLLSKKSNSPQDVETMTLAAADIMGALGCNPATIPGTTATSSRVIASMK